jgi:hypothetical protein
MNLEFRTPEEAVSVLLSRPHLQSVMLPLLAVATQAMGAMQEHQEEPAPRVGRVRTVRLELKTAGAAQRTRAHLRRVQL